MNIVKENEVYPPAAPLLTIRDTINQNTDSRGANINNINQQMLSNLPIIVPPLELQNNFVDLVMNLEQIKIIIDKNLNELDTLYIKKVSEYFN